MSLAIILAVLMSSGAQVPPQATTEQSYLACGCGCCGGVEPSKECVDDSTELEQIIAKDKTQKFSGQCATMGCSAGVEYSICE